jgi:hypothetical protein
MCSNPIALTAGTATTKLGKVAFASASAASERSRNCSYPTYTWLGEGTSAALAAVAGAFATTAKE